MLVRRARNPLRVKRRNYTGILKRGRPHFGRVGRARFLFLVTLLLATSLVVLAPSPVEAAGQISVYRSGLNWPIALDFAPDGRIFFAERLTGSIRIIENGSLLPTPFYTLTSTETSGERGLLGLALDPEFDATPYVYAYQTYDDVTNGTIYNRIVRILANGNTGLPHTVILRMPPLSGATNHNGGVIGFGPDGKLYAVVGENANIALAQDPMSPMGKVLRMNPNGTAPPDNPFYGNASWNSLVYTYGHRNMFGLAFQPFADRIYVTENGPNCNDEVNNLTSGRNYGWGTSAACAASPPPPNDTNRDGPNPVLPIWWWRSTICPTNVAAYGGSKFPAWRGDLFMGDCNFRRLHRLDLSAPGYDTVASDTILWTAPAADGAILDVEEGPDGAVWVTTVSAIYRYWDSAQPPVASFSVSPSPAVAGIPADFDATASSDPDGTIVSYAWEFGDTEIGSGVTISHIYATPGNYTVNLTVTDNESYSVTSSSQVTVQSPPPGPQPPFARFFAAPSPSTPGDPVYFDATASFDPDGTVASYEWDFGDSILGSGVTTTHAYTSLGTYTAALTVRDDQNLTSTTTRDVIVSLEPTAAMAYSPTAIYIGLDIAFDGSGSADPDGAVVSYAWDFGDGTQAIGVQVSHAFAAKGTFAVTLLVVDDVGLSNETSSMIQVRNRGPVIATSNPSPNLLTLVVGEGQTFTVEGSDPDGDALTYAWSIGGLGIGGNDTALTWTSSSPGTYTINVTISDGTASVSREWTVTVVAVASPPWITTWPIVAFAVLVVSGALLLLWVARKRKKQRRWNPR